MPPLEQNRVTIPAAAAILASKGASARSFQQDQEHG